MIRNLLYSLSIHLLIILIIYINFSAKEFIDVKSSEPITISFIAIEDQPVKVEDELPAAENIEPPKDPEPIKEPEPIVEKKVEEKKAPAKIEPIKEKPPEKKIEPIKQVAKAPDPIKEKPPEKKADPVKEPAKIPELVKLKPEEKKEPVKEKPIEKKDPEVEPKKEPIKESPKIMMKKEIKNDNNQKKQIIATQVENDNVEKIQSINLSAREKFSISLQIKRCYKKAIMETALTNNIPVKINVKLDIDGEIKMSTLKILNEKDYINSPSDLEIAMKNVTLALEMCSPIRNLPKDKYAIWQDVELLFDAK